MGSDCNVLIIAYLFTLDYQRQYFEEETFCVLMGTYACFIGSCCINREYLTVFP